MKVKDPTKAAAYREQQYKDKYGHIKRQQPKREQINEKR